MFSLERSTPTTTIVSEDVNVVMTLPWICISKRHLYHQSSTLQHNSITLVRGFTTSPITKQPGGVDNLQCLPTQVVRVQFNLLSLSKVKLGVDLYSAKGEFVMHLSSRMVFSTGTACEVQFGSLVVHHASHNWGGSFTLLFSIYDVTNGKCMDSIRSAQFSTISRRGIEKRNQKRKGSTVVKPVIFHIYNAYSYKMHKEQTFNRIK